MNKSEAIRLAEWAEWFLRNVNDPEDFRWKHMEESTTELRRLHRENQELLEALKSTGLFLHHCWCNVQMNDYSFEKLNLQMEIIDVAIAKVTGEPNV